MSHEKIHQFLVSHIKKFEQDTDEVKISNLSDDALIRMMFSNFRGKDKKEARGLRLTNFGVVVMKKYFKYYEQPFPEGKYVKDTHLVYLDKHSKMPFYCTKTEGFVIFDHELGIKIQTAGGCIETLMKTQKIEDAMLSS